MRSERIFVLLLILFALNRLARQNDTILNAQRSVTETEEVALEITQELSRNREKIDSAHGKVRTDTSLF